jgi:hypothetical protein
VRRINRRAGAGFVTQRQRIAQLASRLVLELAQDRRLSAPDASRASASS